MLSEALLSKPPPARTVQLNCSPSSEVLIAPPPALRDVGSRYKRELFASGPKYCGVGRFNGLSHRLNGQPRIDCRGRRALMVERLPDNRKAGSSCRLPTAQRSTEIMEAQSRDVGSFEYSPPTRLWVDQMPGFTRGRENEFFPDGRAFPSAVQDGERLHRQRHHVGGTVLRLGDEPNTACESM